MEQTTLNALERIENPILVILIVALMVVGIVLWRAYTALQKDMVQVMLQHVQALTNLNATLAGMNERLDGIEARMERIENP
jgi:cytochrome b subunit of formate dehydrogenase